MEKSINSVIYLMLLLLYCVNSISADIKNFDPKHLGSGSEKTSRLYVARKGVPAIILREPSVVFYTRDANNHPSIICKMEYGDPVRYSGKKVRSKYNYNEYFLAIRALYGKCKGKTGWTSHTNLKSVRKLCDVDLGYKERIKWFKAQGKTDVKSVSIVNNYNRKKVAARNKCMKWLKNTGRI